MKKKLIATLLLLTLSTSLVACGSCTHSSVRSESSSHTNDDKNHDDKNDADDAKEDNADNQIENIIPTGVTSHEEDIQYMAFLNGEVEATITGEKSFFPEEDWNDINPSTYCIYDLDEDGVHELIVNANDMWTYVFRFDSNEIIDMDYGEYTSTSHTYFTKDKKALCVDSGHEGRISVIQSAIDENCQYSEDFYLEHWFKDEENGVMEDEYSICYDSSGSGDSTTISREEYLTKLKSTFSGIIPLQYAKIPSANDSYTLTDSSIQTLSMPISEKIESTILAEYTGFLDDKYDEYKDICISKDHQNCRIERFVDDNFKCHFEFSDDSGVLFTTPDFDEYPNVSEIFSFHDLDSDGIDEILLNHYTDSTGGWVVTESYLYKMDSNGSFSETKLFDYDTGITNTAAKNMITADGYFVRDIIIHGGCTDYLVDYGYKDGANVILDYTCVRVFYYDESNVFIDPNLLETTWPQDIQE